MLTDIERENLRKIRELVESTHWIKGNYHGYGEDGKDLYCLVGMINHVEGHHATGSMLIEPGAIGYQDGLGIKLWWKIKKLYPRSKALYIEDWNDRQARKREDVLKVIDALLEEQ